MNILEHGDALAVKTDSMGNIEWWRNYGGEDMDVFNAAVPTADGGYLLGGATESWQDDFSVTKDKGDWYIVKIGAQGNEEFYQRYGNERFNDLPVTDILNTNDSGYVISGRYAPCAEIYPYCSSLQGRIIKLNSDYELEWDYLFNDTVATNSIYEVETDNEGNIYASGRMSAGRGTFHKLNPHGEIIWKRIFYVNNNVNNWNTTALSDFALTSDNGFIITGSGDDVDSEYDYQVILLKLDSLGCDGTYDCDSLLTGTGTWVDLHKGELKVFPNPVVANKNITIEYFTNKPQENYKLELYNMQGMLLQSKNIKAFNQTQIETNMLSPGLYIVRLMDNGICIAEKKILIM